MSPAKSKKAEPEPEASVPTEGDLNALRKESGLSEGAGHMGTLAGWEASPAGQEFKDGEDDNVAAAEEAAEAAHEDLNEEGVSEAETAYVEAAQAAASAPPPEPEPAPAEQSSG